MKRFLLILLAITILLLSFSVFAGASDYEAVITDSWFGIDSFGRSVFLFSYNFKNNTSKETSAEKEVVEIVYQDGEPLCENHVIKTNRYPQPISGITVKNGESSVEVRAFTLNGEANVIIEIRTVTGVLLEKKIYIIKEEEETTSIDETTVDVDLVETTTNNELITIPHITIPKITKQTTTEKQTTTQKNTTIYRATTKNQTYINTIEPYTYKNTTRIETTKKETETETEIDTEFKTYYSAQEPATGILETKEAESSTILLSNLPDEKPNATPKIIASTIISLIAIASAAAIITKKKK